MTNTTLVSQWLYRPQNVSLRKALFQVHLWAGIALGLYILLISISGSAIVFRNEISKAYSARRRSSRSPGRNYAGRTKTSRGARVSAIFRQLYLGSQAPQRSHRSVALRGGDNKMRLFDPYTGKDLGDSVPFIIRALTLDHRLAPQFVSRQNGPQKSMASPRIFTTVLVLTGAVLWWPGMGSGARA